MTLDELETKVTDLWNNHKWLFILIAIPFAILKFRSVIIDLLVKDSRKIITEDTKKDEVLKKEENEANAQANQIIADANKAKATSDKQDVPDDWFKK